MDDLSDKGNRFQHFVIRPRKKNKQTCSSNEEVPASDSQEGEGDEMGNDETLG